MSEEEPRGHAHGISRWEWLVAALGLSMLVATIWILLAARFDLPRRPPDVAVRVREVVRVSNGWLVRIEAENAGDETAAGLRIQGALARAGAAPEQAETQLDFLPGRSTRRAGLFFAADPRAGRLELRAVSFQEP